MCLLTFSIDDPPSFKNLETWRKEFVYYADVKADFPFLVVGNKVKMSKSYIPVSSQVMMIFYFYFVVCIISENMEHPNIVCTF